MMMKCTAASPVLKAKNAPLVRPSTVCQPRAAAVVAKASARDQLAAGLAGAVASVVLLANPTPAFADADTLTTLTGETPATEVGNQVLDDMAKVEASVNSQPTAAVRQAADEVKQVVVDQAKELVDNGGQPAPPPKGPGLSAQQASQPQATEQAAQGLEANLAQLKSILGL